MNKHINNDVLKDYNIVDTNKFFRSRQPSMTITIREYNATGGMLKYNKYYFVKKRGKNEKI